MDDNKKVTTETKTASQMDNKEEECNYLLVAAGSKLASGGENYIGSASVHIYAGSDLGVSPAVYFKIQTCLTEAVDEGIASHAWEQLKKALQLKFGRLN